jgi:3-hydroxyisobutyrate dehydrogenase-like beta-hydroxyacid dehydrogenase
MFNKETTTVGFIGLGNMVRVDNHVTLLTRVNASLLQGLHMCTNLVKNGYTVRGYDLSAESLKKLSDKGIAGSSS